MSIISVWILVWFLGVGVGVTARKLNELCWRFMCRKLPGFWHYGSNTYWIHRFLFEWKENKHGFYYRKE